MTTTAYLTTDPSCLTADAQGRAEVDIYTRHADGEMTGDGPLWSAVTSQPADNTPAPQAEAEQLLAEAGWRLAGDWELHEPAGWQADVRQATA